MKKLLIPTLLVLAALAMPVKAQLTPSFSNAVSQLKVIELFNGVIPNIDPNATNSFNAGELEIMAGAAWKTLNASGSTPYANIAVEKYLLRLKGGSDIGIGGNAVTFGNGAGSSSLDSIALYGVGRKYIGNFAGFGLLGAARDLSLNKYALDIGGGFEFRYKTGFGLNVGSRFRYAGDGENEKGFLTCINMTWHF